MNFQGCMFLPVGAAIAARTNVSSCSRLTGCSSETANTFAFVDDFQHRCFVVLRGQTDQRCLCCKRDVRALLLGLKSAQDLQSYTCQSYSWFFMMVWCVYSPDLPGVATSHAPIFFFFCLTPLSSESSSSVPIGQRQRHQGCGMKMLAMMNKVANTSTPGVAVLSMKAVKGS